MKSSLPPSKSNRRGGPETTKLKNVFGDDDDDSDSSADGRTGGDARANVNKQLSKVQAALRQRAQAMMATNPYEDYEEQSANTDAASQHRPSQDKEEPERKSRYIADLLETANKRRRERETIQERKIAKQQALEEAEEDFSGKEKFITKAYRQKLEERKQWEADEAERQRQEEAQDVTQLTTAGAAMASFYGNISKNVAMGGTNPEVTAASVPKKEQKRIRHDSEDDDIVPNKGGGMGFLSGFELSGEEPTEAVARDNVEIYGNVASAEEAPGETKEKDPMASELTARERRERKVAEARIRYLQRKGLALEQ